MGNNKYAGTETEKNLRNAFSGESEARNKYSYFASVAKKEGYEQIAALFQKTADNEKEHAKMWFKELQGIGNSEENLILQPIPENLLSLLFQQIRHTYLSTRNFLLQRLTQGYELYYQFRSVL